MRYLNNEPLAKHTSIKIGGPARLFCSPTNLSELREALSAKDKKIVIGRGTNLLFSDSGYDGLVIETSRCCHEIKIEGQLVRVGAGLSLDKLVDALAEQNLGGLEFLAGIPGSVGGAVTMNAGAWGSEIGGFVESVKVIDFAGREKTLKRDELKFAYRSSAVAGIVVEAVLAVKPGADVKAIADYRSQRQRKHPLDLPNCGSVFKNPKPDSAAKLIEAAGCKGLKAGRAQVSEKHANFIVNLGGASAADVVSLIKQVQSRVKEVSNIFLEPEVRIVLE